MWAVSSTVWISGKPGPLSASGCSAPNQLLEKRPILCSRQQRWTLGQCFNSSWRSCLSLFVSF